MKQDNGVEFDRFAEEYDALQKENLGAFGKDLSVFPRYKVELSKSLLKAPPRTILEFGCGVGRNLPYLQQFFPKAEIHACDVSAKSLEFAATNNPQVNFSHIECPEDLIERYADKVDFILVTCVLHHIPEKEQSNWFNSLYLTLRSQGQLIIFEHNPYNPLTRHMFNTCPYDAGGKLVAPKQCRKLFQEAGFVDLKQLYTLFFLWRTKFWVNLERSLYWLPLGGQYCMLARRS